ncbi:MAG: peroxiredoxin [Pseudomonadota bacterium]
MTIAVGSSLPDVTLHRATADGPEAVQSKDLFAGRKVVLFAVPGAFTPTCSIKHLPGFVGKADEIKAKGVDEIFCLASNDAFVMQAWAKSENVGDSVTMLADGSLNFTSATGLELDLRERGLGMRANRYVMVVDDNKVTHLAVEGPGEFEVSSAEAVLKAL